MANNSVQEAKAKAQDAAGKTADHAKDLAHDAADKARDVAGSVADAGRSALSAAGKAADNAAGKAGDALDYAADKVREYGPKDGVLGRATEAVAGGVERSGDYLSSQGLSGLTGDLTEMIKRNPLPALLLGVGIGYILAKMTSSRS